MNITKEILAGKILEYLNRSITANDLAMWAESAMIDSHYQEEYFKVISEALAKIGLTNVKSFELPIAFYLNVLIQLDYLTVFGLQPSTTKINKVIYA